MKLQPGDKIMCKQAVEARYSRYGGRPECWFTPDMVATVIDPEVTKVRIVRDDTHDGKPVFVLAEFTSEGRVWRVALNYCNIVKLPTAIAKATREVNYTKEI